MLFGPSESLVIADDGADPVLLAADLLNEAEHGSDSAALLVTPSEGLVAEVSAALDTQLALLPEPRRSHAAAAVSDYGGGQTDLFGEGSGMPTPVAVENFQMLQQRQTGEDLVGGGDKRGRVNLLNWDGRGMPEGLFPDGERVGTPDGASGGSGATGAGEGGPR